MSEIFTSEGVQYILNDSELIFDQSQDSGNLSDVSQIINRNWYYTVTEL